MIEMRLMLESRGVTGSDVSFRISVHRAAPVSLQGEKAITKPGDIHRQSSSCLPSVRIGEASTQAIWERGHIYRGDSQQGEFAGVQPLRNRVRVEMAAFYTFFRAQES
jgi:hypothetical protein